MKKILVVDDQVSVRTCLRQALEHWNDNLDLSEACDGQEALEQVEKETYDLMICDIRMPRMNGFEVLRRVRMDEKTRQMPVIMLTTEAEDKDFAVGYQLGATSYLTKPFNLDELIEALELHV